MVLQRIYYKRSWETAPEDQMFIYETAGEVLVYHYWFSFDKLCLHFSPIEKALEVCNAPQEGAKPFFLASDEMDTETMHSSFSGVKLEKIVDAYEAEDVFWFCFDNDSIISIELYWGITGSPGPINSYWKLRFFTHECRCHHPFYKENETRPDFFDLWIPKYKSISIESLRDTRNGKPIG